MARFSSRIIFLLVVAVVTVCTSGCGITTYEARQDTLLQPRYHVVRRGETLDYISRSYKISQKKLALLNGLRSAKDVEPGQKLLVGYRKENGTSAGSGVSLKRASYQRGSTSSSRRDTGFIPPQGGRLLWPVDGGDIVSGFGPRSGSFHDGLDIAASEGTTVLAAHTGRVAYAGNGLGGFGNLVIIKGDDGLLTVYGHNRRILVRQGARVKRGQAIARVGETGRASGPHLHFEVRWRDKQKRYVAVDPLPLLQGGQLARLRYRVNESLTPLLAKLGIW